MTYRGTLHQVQPDEARRWQPDLTLGLVHLYTLGVKVKIDRSFELARVRHAAGFLGLTQGVNHVCSQGRPDKRAATGFRLQNGPPSGQLEDRHVRTMAVGDEDVPKTMVRHTARNIHYKMQQ